MIKKLICTAAALLAGVMLSVNAAAVSLSALPLASEKECGYQSLEKNVTLKANLEIEEDELFVIPRGKRLKLAGEKTLTLNGKLYIENGGSLVIESGEFLLGENAAVFSNGKINVKSGGRLTAAKGSSLVVSPVGSLSVKGGIYTSLEADCIACLGKYSGSKDGIKAEILSAVSFSETDIYNAVYEDFRAYDADGAKKLFPTDIGIDEKQENPSGGTLSVMRFFCGNGQTIEVITHGQLDGKTGIIGGIHVTFGK